MSRTREYVAGTSDWKNWMGGGDNQKAKTHHAGVKKINVSKSKQTQFKKGHSPTVTLREKSDPVSRRVERFNEEEHAFVVKSTQATDIEFSMPGADGVEGNAISSGTI